MSHLTNNRSCPSSKAYFKLLPNKRVRIYFSKQSMSADLLKFHFANKQFVVATPLELPAEILKQLGIDYYAVSSGVYQVYEDTSFMMIDV